MTVWLERQGGGFTQGFAVAETFAPDAQEVDFRGLKLEGDRLSGEVKVSWRPFHMTAGRKAHHGIGAKTEAPPVVRTYPVDLVLKKHEVATEYNEDELKKGGVAMVSAIRFDAPKDRSANGTSASVGLAGRIMRSNRRSWLGRMRPDRGGAAELSIHAQGQIFLVGADRP